MAYWLLKSEPSAFSWQRLQKDGKAMWDGVRNYQARNNLRAMQVGDLGFFYHSVDERQIVGVVRVVKTAYPDPTAPGEDWSVVDVVGARSFGHASRTRGNARQMSAACAAVLSGHAVATISVTPKRLQ